MLGGCEMILTFKEIGIHLPDYHGLTFQQIHPLIINKCADYILSWEGDYDYEIFTHYDWQIDYVCKMVIIPNRAFA